MTTLGMYDNEGDIALAQKLNEALDAMPEDLTADERFAFVNDALRADSDFCAKHSEWSDNDVRDAIAWWAESPTKFSVSDERATFAVEFHFPIEFTTLDGDTRSVLDEKSDEVHAIIESAVQDALALIEKRVGRIAGEWSGISVTIT